MVSEEETGEGESGTNPFGLTFVYLSGRQIQVLAHPLRVRLLGHLRADGPATATQLAAELTTNTGATSYHLRQLAEAGLVVEEERAGGGRQRWWRAAHDMSSWQRGFYADDPEATAAAEWMETQQVNRFAELARSWRQSLPGESAEWQEAGGISDYLITLDAEQAEALIEEVDEVIERHRAAAGAEPRPGARPVALYVGVLPETSGRSGHRTTE
ncbi:MAG TPA: helix-turn-helix domain-containing protein [Actinoplanes sp.]|nr:helix-turn-helix domain-containing protein [Actinoplanes sp.]